MPSRPMSPPGTVAVLVGLAALVGLASHGAPLWSFIRPGHPDRAAVVLGVAVVWVLGGLAVFLAVAGLHRRRRVRGRDGTPALRTALARAAPGATVVLTTLSLLAIARAEPGLPRPGSPAPGHVPEESGRTALPLSIDWWGGFVVTSQGEDGRAPVETDRTAPGAKPHLIIVIVTLLATAVAVAGWRWLSRAGDAAAEPEDDAADEHRDALRGALAGTIDAMLADPDPGTAIRGAYARLLEALAGTGARRLEHEGPVEHLHRILALLDVRPEPLRELIDLFQVARFSTHPLRALHRDRALRALRAVAADLEPVDAAAGATP